MRFLTLFLTLLSAPLWAQTPTDTDTYTPTITDTNTPSITDTNTPSITATDTPTITDTNTPSPTISATSTISGTFSPSPTASPTSTITPTPLPSFTSTPWLISGQGLSFTNTAAISWQPAQMPYPNAAYQVFEGPFNAASLNLTETVDAEVVPQGSSQTAIIGIPCGTSISVAVAAEDDAGDISPNSLTYTVDSPCVPSFSVLGFSVVGGGSGVGVQMQATPPTSALVPTAVFYSYTTYPAAANTVPSPQSPGNYGTSTITLPQLYNSYYIRSFASDTNSVTVNGPNDFAIMPAPSLRSASPVQGGVFLDLLSVTPSAQVPNLSGYAIYYDLAAPTTSSASLTISAGSILADGSLGLTISPLVNGTPYYFAAASFGGSPNFQGALGNTLSAIPMVPYAALSSVQQSAGGPLSISWTPVTVLGQTITSYSLYGSPDTSFASLTLYASCSACAGAQVTFLGTSYTSQNYFFVALSESSSLSSSLTPPSAAYVDIPQLPAPLVTSTSSDSRIILNWPAVVSASSYNLQVLADGNTVTANLALNSTSYVDANAQSNVPNAYSISAQTLLPNSLGTVQGPYSYVDLVPMNPPGEPGQYFGVLSGTILGSFNYLTAAAVPEAVTGFADVHLLWSPALPGSQGISSYNVYGRGLTTTVAAIPTTATSFSFVDNHVDATQHYLYGVQAFDLAGASGQVLTASVGAYQYIGPPANLTASLGFNRSIQLNWTTPSAASGIASSYSIYRSSAANGLGTLLATSFADSFTDTTTPNTSPIFYYLFTIDEFGLTSTSVSQVTIADPASGASNGIPLTVTGVTAQSVSGTPSSYFVSWSPNSSLDQVNFYTLSFNGVPVTNTAATACLLQSLSAYTGLGVSFTVYATNFQGLSGPAGQTVTTSTPPAPLDLSIPARDDSNPNDTMPGLQLLWADMGVTPGYITGYTVYRSASSFNTPGGGSVIASAITLTSYRDTSVLNNASYYYAITSEQNGVESPLSNLVAISTTSVPGAPFNVTANALAQGGAIQISWTVGTGVTPYGYWVYRGTNVVSGELNNSTFGYTDNNPGQLTPLSYTVAASNFMGQGPQSSIVSASALPGPISALAFSETQTPQLEGILNWNAPATAASSYQVQIWTTVTAATTITADVTTTSYVDTTMLAAADRFYSVTALSGTSQSLAVSLSVQVYGPPSLPRGLTMTGLAGDQVILSWEPPNAKLQIQSITVNYSIFVATSAALSLSQTVTLTGNANALLIGSSLDQPPAVDPVYVTATIQVVNGLGVTSAALAAYGAGATNGVGGVPPPLSFSAAVAFVEAGPNQSFTRLSWVPPLDPTVFGNPEYEYVIYQSTSGVKGLFQDFNGGPKSPLYVETVPIDTSSGITTVAVVANSAFTYSYAITSLNPSIGYGSGESQAVLAQPFRVSPYSYPAYVSITSAQAASNRIDFSWNPPAYMGTSGGLASVPYVIYRYTESGNAAIPFGSQAVDAGFPVSTAATSFSDTQVMNENFYFYYIAVVDSFGKLQNPPLPVSPLALGPASLPDPPYAFLAIPGNNEVVLTWLINDDPSPPFYDVYRSSTTSATPVLLSYLSHVGPSSSQFESGVTQLVDTLTDTSAADRTTWCYSMAGVNSVGEGQRSSQICVTPYQPLLPPANSTVTLTLASPNNVQEVLLSWQPAQPQNLSFGFPLSGYQVLRSSDGGATFSSLTQLSACTTCATAYTDLNISFGSSYVYKVVPFDTQFLPSGGQFGAGEPYQLATVTIPQAVDSILVRRNAINPINGDTCPIQYSQVTPGYVWIRIYNLHGELVRHVLDARLDSTTTANPPSLQNPYLSPIFYWDGTNDNGQMVASGVYLIHMDGPGISQDARVAVIKADRLP